MGAEPADELIVCTVAAPRQMAMAGVYTGAELLTRSSRPGAYDAMAIPSLFNGRKRLPGDHEAATVYVPREIAPQPLKVSPRNSIDEPRTLTREFPTVYQPRGEYRPHAGSTPAKVLAHLRALGGFISHAEICERFDIKRSAITAAFKPILKHGVLVRQVVDGYTGFSLPGWSAPLPRVPSEPFQTAWRAEVDELHAVQAAGKEMPTTGEKLNIVFATGARDFLSPGNENRRFWPIQPATVTALTKDESSEVSAFLRALPEELHYRPVGQGQQGDASKFTPDQLSALYALSLREAELGLLLGYLAVLQLRQHFADGDRIYPFPPLTEPPRLTDAA
ncbi:MarR family transcriptional regulator [Variovorax sp. PAMC26660]|uniref:MarR family transcriptional regulator n=1 Tax=Variovorax sp. PAMC26660 TaxID=2762322 RepID=UPI00164D4038|nr:MarR family transcriptional regulator [Variovorax sp. PAMC26660]QNK67834.1 hypothetical protein H7F35_32710 [Variovorax sp. PAMC26660]